MIQKIRSDYFIKIGVKNRKVNEIDWSDMYYRSTEEFNEKKDIQKYIIKILKQAIKKVSQKVK